jgi:hypothetical protein
MPPPSVAIRRKREHDALGVGAGTLSHYEWIGMVIARLATSHSSCIQLVADISRSLGAESCPLELISIRQSSSHELRR